MAAKARNAMLGVRFTDGEMEGLQKYAKANKFKNLSNWARGVLLAELNGENRDALGDFVRNMPRMPRDPDSIITCGSCGHTRMIEAKPVFVPVGMERPKPVYEDPGCPKCGAGQPQKLPEAAYQAIDRMKRDNENVTGPPPRCLECGALLSELQHTCQGRPDHVPSGIVLEREITDVFFIEAFGPKTREEFARRYPREAAAALETIPIYVAKQVNEHLKNMAPRSWSSEWEAMDQMEPGEAMARFTELRAGRQLPAGFAKWPRAQMVAWLEREWPL